MDGYKKHREEFARSLREITAAVIRDPNAALCQTLLSLRLLSESLAELGHVKLYKYQPYNERNIRDFLTGAIHMSSPNSFNDVNEGWQRFDESVICGQVFDASNMDVDKKLVNEWDTFVGAMKKAGLDTMPTIEQVTKLWNAYIGMESDLSSLTSNMVAASRDGLSIIRRSTRCACFSEAILSASMWDRYAHGHTGFALCYDFAAFSPVCSFGRECVGGSKKTGFLAPVFYGRRDDLSMLFMACCLLPGLPRPDNNLYFLTMLNMFSKKASEWSYEREWRILTSAYSDENDHVYVMKRPEAVYLGLKMEADEKRRLIDAANRIGLDIYSMEMDYNSEDYSLKPLPYSRILNR